MIARRTRHGWKTTADYRQICPCQKHQGRERSMWRRVARIASRSVAAVVSVPVLVTMFDLPIAAMNMKSVNLDALYFSKPQPAAVGQSATLPIFTTPGLREQFLSTTPIMTSVDAFKEQFFRNHVPYGEIIYREARRNNLQPELVAAMVQTESDFRAGLVSHKSAQGLMQIVPETAKVLGMANPFDPEQNIAAGTRYFRILLERFDDERIALAAYNAGPTNVERFGGVPPFPETQQYIEKVYRRHNRYRERVRTGYVTTMRIGNLGH